MISPVEYLQSFQEVRVVSSNDSWSPVTVSVDRYLLNTPQRSQSIMNERSRLAAKIKKDMSILRAADQGSGISVRIDGPAGPVDRTFADFSTSAADQLWALVRYPFVGKGSPEAIATALQLAAVDLPGSPPIVTPPDFQAYCDKWLGLDCNGFVGNYLRHVRSAIAWDDVNQTKAIGPDSDIATIWNGYAGTAFDHSSEVDPANLILAVMVDKGGKIIPGGSSGYGHILLSGPGESTELDGLTSRLGVDRAPAICTVESTAAVDPGEGKNGLFRGWSAYSDKPGQPGVFLLYRALGRPAISVRMKGAAWTG